MTSGLVLTSFRPAMIRAGAASGGERRSPPKSGGGNWWTPLFGWSSEPDYIDGGAAPDRKEMEEEKKTAAEAGEVLRPSPPAGTRRIIAFTEEKARELRMRTMETETFHDVMYHSAIAARLATDLPRRNPGRQ